MDAVVTVVCVVGGLLLGDRLELVVDRVGAKRSLARPWYDCPHCRRSTTPWGAVPLIDVLTRRHCPHCNMRAAHAERPLILAVVSAAVLGAFAASLGAQAALAAYAVLGLALVAMSAVDLEHMRIPNRILYPSAAAVTVLLVLASAVDGKWGSLGRAAVSAAVAFVAFLAVWFAVPNGMGFGDVRLAGLIGGACGWLGYGHAFLAFLAAFVLGSVVGLGVMVFTHGGRKTRIPFGPFLALGAVVSVVWGNPLGHALFHRAL